MQLKIELQGLVDLSDGLKGNNLLWDIEFGLRLMNMLDKRMLR